MVLMLLLSSVLALAFNIQPVKAEGIIIGEWFTDGRIALCIHSFETAPTIDYYPYKPDTSGYIWAWVDLSLENVGTKEISTNSLYAYLKDNQNYMYRGRSVANAPKNFKLLDLPPGETLRGEIYFEVPQDAIIVAFVWYDYKSYIVIPEFSSITILLLLMLTTLIAIIFVKKERKLKSLLP